MLAKRKIGSKAGERITPIQMFYAVMVMMKMLKNLMRSARMIMKTFTWVMFLPEEDLHSLRIHLIALNWSEVNMDMSFYRISIVLHVF